MLRIVFIAFWVPLAAFGQDGGAPAVRLRTAAERALTERFPGDAYRLDVRVKRVEATIEAADGLRVLFAAGDGLPRGTTQVKLLAGDDRTGWRQAGWALLYLAHYDSVLVARAAVPSGKDVAPDAVEAVWMETTTFRGEPLRPPAWRVLAAAGPVYATRTLREGRALRRDDLRPPYAAETGASVTMRYRRGGLTFDLVCKAREAGHVDDMIRLYSSDTRKTYRARLTGPGTAAWIETL